MSSSQKCRTRATELWARTVAELPDTVSGREQVDAAVARQVAAYVAAEPNRGPRRVRRQRALIARVRAVLAQARALDDSTALLAVAALNGDPEAVESLQLLADEPVAPVPDELHLRQSVWQRVQDSMRANGMSLQQLDELAAAGHFTDAVERQLTHERWEYEQLQQREQERAPQLVAVCRELLALVDELANAYAAEPALVRAARAIALAVGEQLRLLAVRATHLPPPWIPAPRRKLVGAVQPCAPPVLAADESVTYTGHVAAVAA